MRIAVMSDSHDHIWNLRKALEVVKKEKTGMIIHCGDFIAPFMLKELNAAGLPVHGVFGNNDGDQHTLTRLSMEALSHITLHGLIGRINAEPGRAIAFTHQGDVAEGLAASGSFELVCFGHTHEFQLKRSGKSILLNPGEIMGKEGSPGFSFVDTDNWEVKRVEIS